MSARHRPYIAYAPANALPGSVFLLPSLAPHHLRRLSHLRERAPAWQGSRLIRIGLGEPAVDRLRLSIGMRLYGAQGALLLLDALIDNLSRLGAIPRLADLARHCLAEGGVLVIATRRSEPAARRLVDRTLRDAMEPRRAQVALGRRRSTTSKPTISMPSGGTG
jgi:hypothetical protein